MSTPWRLRVGERSYLRPESPLRSATAVAETEVLVGRLVATNEQAAQWDGVSAPPDNS